MWCVCGCVCMRLMLYGCMYVHVGWVYVVCVGMYVHIHMFTCV